MDIMLHKFAKVIWEKFDLFVGLKLISKYKTKYEYILTNLKQYSLEQWFPTGVPRHTRVLQRGVSGAAKFWIYCLFINILLQIVIFYLGKGVVKFFWSPLGCREPKKVE
jgi:hypothetical protein